MKKVWEKQRWGTSVIGKKEKVTLVTEVATISFSSPVPEEVFSHSLPLVIIITIGLPWWLSGKAFACACRTQRFHPWSGKIPHAVEQLSPHTTALEPALQSPGAATAELTRCNCWSLQAEGPCPASGEPAARRSLHVPKREQPPLPTTRESPCVATKTQCSHEKINK